MKRLLLLMTIVSVMFAASCNKCKEPSPLCIDNSKINKNPICTDDLRPVCGCNGVTYENICLAENAGVIRWTEGECQNDLK